MKTITIIGFGRFGKTLYRLIKDDFSVTIFIRTPLDKQSIQLTENTIIATTLEQAYQSDNIFFAVPISAFESVIAEHQSYFKQNHVLIDVLSVKVHPANIFKKFLDAKNMQYLLTHPMFGPDSSKEGFEGLPIILDRESTNEETYTFWKKYFFDKHLRVIEMSADEHDRLAARSQGLTHFIGRLLEKVDFSPTPIDSMGSKKLQEVKDQTCNDTWELFRDLQTYNPYTKQMRLNLGEAYTSLYNQLLPDRVNPDYFIYGIQGGSGSFNEEALLNYVGKHTIADFKTEYLYTTEKVLKNLHEGNIDYGLFAITNSTGGLVEESMHALTKYPCQIVEDFEILIRHFLMRRQDATNEDIDTIMAHPQVLKQCEKTLAEKYSNLRLQSGEGDMVDTAKAAEQLSLGNLPKNIAILGPQTLSVKYNFHIIAENLQDKKDNFTRFLLVKR